MAEEKLEKGTFENPLTLEDVLQAIEENGGTADGLDLSGKVLQDGIDLSGLNLVGIILRDSDLRFSHLERTNLWNAHLERAELWDAHIESASLLCAHLEEADLRAAHLEGADLGNAALRQASLRFAHLEGAILWGACLEGTNLAGARFSPDTKLELVDWGDYIEEDEGYGDFVFAADAYRRLKQWYTSAGMHDVAAEFHYREMETQRKRSQQVLKESLSIRLWRKSFKKLRMPWEVLLLALTRECGTLLRLWVYRLVCGYAERPYRVVSFAGFVIFGLALVYFIAGGVWQWAALWRSLYFSTVSFTALGYGSWVYPTNDAIRALGAIESFIGVFSIALFLVTFIRKMTR